MKTILKVFITILIIGCNSDNNTEIQTCETQDLGITEEYKNPYPEVAEADFGYRNWKWNIINDTVLRIKTSYPAGFVESYEYYYFSIDRKNNCLSFIIAKFRSGSDVEIEDGTNNEDVVYPESSDYTLKIQYWQENNKFIGQIIPNTDNPDSIIANQRFFWVELNDENHEAQTEEEDYWGL